MTALCAAAAVTPGQATLVRLSQSTSVILLQLADGTLTAYRNACPHMGIELDWEPGRLLTRNGRYLRCSGHDALFDPTTGLCVRGPCQGDSLTRLPIRVSNGMVLLDDRLTDWQDRPEPTVVGA